MARFGKRFTRRGPMTTKQGNVNYYKGTRGRSEGVHTAKGAFATRPERLLTIVPPANLAACELKPYVHRAVRRPPVGERVPDYTAGAGAGAPGGPRMR